MLIKINYIQVNNAMLVVSRGRALVRFLRGRPTPLQIRQRMDFISMCTLLTINGVVGFDENSSKNSILLFLADSACFGLKYYA